MSHNNIYSVLFEHRLIWFDFLTRDELVLLDIVSNELCLVTGGRCDSADICRPERAHGRATVEARGRAPRAREDPPAGPPAAAAVIPSISLYSVGFVFLDYRFVVSQTSWNWSQITMFKLYASWQKCTSLHSTVALTTASGVFHRNKRWNLVCNNDCLFSEIVVEFRPCQDNDFWVKSLFSECKVRWT